MCDYLIFGYLRSLLSIGVGLSLRDCFKGFISKEGALVLFVLVVFLVVGVGILYFVIEAVFVNSDISYNYFVHWYTMFAISVFCFLVSVSAVIRFLCGLTPRA